MTKSSQVLVPDATALESAVTSYIAQGFTVQSRTESSAVLYKKKEFNVVWAIVGFLVCLLPLLVYLIVYAADNDRMVEIRIGPVGQVAAPQMTAGVIWSDDARFWWDGRQWRPASETPPQ